ncbi:TRAP transporter large permease [Nitrincola alkalilacustris]|uniref:TRAP transporter large permease n=1 Tax=Nitrincola alkalilacustris TaxID=1571224 RepID=UPI00124C20BF|nr:TRAP transporter large permease [Nitrincola alkalilacustris]
MTAIAFFALLFIGLPVVFVLLVTAAVYVVRSNNLILFDSLPQQLFSGIESYGLLAIPLFMLTGELMNRGGVTRRLVGMASLFLGSLRGGLAYINIVANMMMASIMGSAIAQIAVMSKVMVPEMEKAGYDRAFAGALTAAGGLLSPIIPPSMLFIIYGVLAQVPIGDMFIAGILPGLLLFVLFIVIVAILGYRYNYPQGRKVSVSEIRSDLFYALPALSIPLVIVGSILLGIATPTESAGVATVLSFVIGRFVYRSLKISDLGEILKDTATGSATVIVLIAAAHVLGWVLVFEQLPQQVAVWMSGITSDPFAFMLLVTLSLLLIGMVLDGIAALILIVPILLPIAVNNYQIDPVHFGVVVCINLVLGLLTPPVGTGLYVTANMSNVSMFRIFNALLPFLVACLGVLVLLSWLPWLTTGLLSNR